MKTYHNRENLKDILECIKNDTLNSNRTAMFIAKHIADNKLNARFKDAVDFFYYTTATVISSEDNLQRAKYVEFINKMLSKELSDKEFHGYIAKYMNPEKLKRYIKYDITNDIWLYHAATVTRRSGYILGSVDVLENMLARYDYLFHDVYSPLSLDSHVIDMIYNMRTWARLRTNLLMAVNDIVFYHDEYKQQVIEALHLLLGMVILKDNHKDIILKSISVITALTKDDEDIRGKVMDELNTYPDLYQ